MVNVALLIRKPEHAIYQELLGSKLKCKLHLCKNPELSLQFLIAPTPLSHSPADVECDANIQNISHSVISLRQLRSTKVHRLQRWLYIQYKKISLEYFIVFIAALGG
ncbi:hypothetical protein CEXT_403441 [Caerostris extrusa]|uniref:Uncharacterized protein n=1 Tax=Caerostris extrusa TaxID=172846 RepID=A0AAV4V467_CAEEX|nr:hypothetical protein CEXT_403441 [Caerostris extrusa]